jgi:serine/threonine-protein kinase
MSRAVPRVEHTTPSGSAHSESRKRARSGARLPQTGDVIAGKYALGNVIGEGGMGVVYEATHTRLHQRLAIKVLRPDVPDFKLVLERFEREARATAQLRTIHAARVIDVDTMPDGLPYLVMEFLEGADLDAELRKTGPMAVEEAVDIVLQVAEAMAEAHALGIVHRDLKPSNMFVCRIGGRRIVKVLDFGISKIGGDGDSRITGSNAYFGTPCYTAPEQLLSAAAADVRSDVWSLGIVLFELLTGRTPFVGSATEVIARTMAEPIPWPLELRPDLPEALARVMMRALRRDPGQRFQSMQELAETVAPFGPAQSTATVVADAQRGRGRLGEILVSEGLISAADLERALAEQRRSGKLLGRVFLDMALVAHADLLTALAKQQGIGAGTQVVGAVADASARDREARVATTFAPAPTSRAAERRLPRLWLWVAVAVGLLVGIALAVLAGSALRH